MSDLKKAEASLEKKADSIISKFKTRRSWQVLGAVIFGLVTATLVFNARAASDADGLVLGTDSNNCVISQGAAVKETNQNTTKRNANICQISSGGAFSPVLFRFGTTNLNNKTGNHTAAINEYKSRDKNTVETCFYLRSINGTARVNLIGLGESGSRTDNVTVTEANYEDYCIKSKISDGTQNLGIEVTNGTVRVSSALLYATKENIIPVQPGEGFFFDFEDPNSLDEWSKSIYHRDDYIVSMQSWLADHDLSCGPPTTTRTVTRGTRDVNDDGKFFNQDWLYWCNPGPTGVNGHWMSSIGDTSGYSTAAIYKTFENVKEIKWDVNITNLGNRQWTEVKLWPKSKGKFDQFGQLIVPCMSWVGDFGTCASDIDGDDKSDGRTARDYEAVGAIGLSFEGNVKFKHWQTGDHNYWGVWDEWINPNDPARSSKAIRRKHFLRDNGNNTITYGIEKADGSFHETTGSGSFPTGEVYVAFADHNYTPNKDQPRQPVGYTWHWDNIHIK